MHKLNVAIPSPKHPALFLVVSITLFVALGACGGSGETSDVAVPEAPAEPIPVMMPGSGVVVQPARANWDTGYFSEALYSRTLEALGYEVLDHKEMENADFYEAVARGDVTFWANG